MTEGSKFFRLFKVDGILQGYILLPLAPRISALRSEPIEQEKHKLTYGRGLTLLPEKSWRGPHVFRIVRAFRNDDLRMARVGRDNNPPELLLTHGYGLMSRKCEAHEPHTDLVLYVKSGGTRSPE